MKKLIILFAIAGVFWGLKNNSSILNVKMLAVGNTEVSATEIKKIQSTFATVPSVESIKDEVINDERFKSESDYISLLKEKEKKMDDLQLIQKANSGKLTAEENQTLLRLMREKIAINQIILDEKIKNFEGKYL